jgi:hypothetical protein
LDWRLRQVIQFTGEGAFSYANLRLNKGKEVPRGGNHVGFVKQEAQAAPLVTQGAVHVYAKRLSLLPIAIPILRRSLLHVDGESVDGSPREQVVAALAAAYVTARAGGELAALATVLNGSGAVAK